MVYLAAPGFFGEEYSVFDLLPTGKAWAEAGMDVTAIAEALGHYPESDWDLILRAYVAAGGDQVTATQAKLLAGRLALPPASSSAKKKIPLGYWAAGLLAVLGVGAAVALVYRRQHGLGDAMASWIAKYRGNTRVRRWIARNPPPAGWQGTPMEWAFTEMPFAPR